MYGNEEHQQPKRTVFFFITCPISVQYPLVVENVGSNLYVEG